MPQNEIYPVTNEELPSRVVRVEKLSTDDKREIHFHLDAEGKIVWLEIVSPASGDVLEIDPNHFDISEYRELLASERRK